MASPVDHVVVNGNRAAIAENHEHDAVPAQQSGKRHDERRQPHDGHNEPIENADERPHR